MKRFFARIPWFWLPILVATACGTGENGTGDPDQGRDGMLTDVMDPGNETGPGDDSSPPRDAADQGEPPVDAVDADTAPPDDVPEDVPDAGQDQDISQECDPDGDTRASACGGLNGRATLVQTCILGTWTDTGDCVDPDFCTDGATRDVPCQDETDGDETQECIEGRWTYLGDCRPAAPCTDDDVRTVPCGRNGNGTQAQICVDSAWTNDGDCQDPDECRNGLQRTESCGVNGIGNSLVLCVDGRFVAGECMVQFTNRVGWPKDIRTLGRQPRVFDMVEAGGRVFVHVQAEPGNEDLLWMDAANGPLMGMEPRFIRRGQGSTIRTLTPAGDRVFFQRDDGIHGGEAWLTDGTEAGTLLVGDLIPGTASSAEAGSRLASGTFGGRTWFFASQEDGMHLYSYAGDRDGIRHLASVFSSRQATRFVQMGDIVYFPADTNAQGTNLWRSNGTSEGTYRVKDIRPNTPDGTGPEHLTVYRDRLYFRAASPDGPGELYVSDGTEAGTVMLAVMLGGVPVGSSPSNLTVIDDRLYYSATREAFQGEVWRTDGTAAGTVRMTSIGGQAGAENFHKLGDHLVFTAKHATHDRQWWKLPLVGPNPTATLIKTLTPAEGSTPWYWYVTQFGNRIYFAFTDATGLKRLYSTDGSAAGTRPESDRDPALAGEVGGIFAVGGSLYVTIEVETQRHRLYRIVPDGTAVQIPLPVDRSGLKGQRACALPDGRLVFMAEADSNGVQPWISDGTTAGTMLVMPVNTADRISTWNEGFTCFGNAGIFAGSQPDTGVEPWLTGGELRNTRLLRDVNPGTSSGDPRRFAVIGSKVYFSGRDGSGSEPWHSDGTTPGTVRVADIEPGSGSSQPNEFTGIAPAQAGGDWKVLFRATSDAHGEELWVHDGSGTRMVKDINTSGSTGSRPKHLAAMGSNMYFSASDSAAGRELWRSDGTEAKTVMVADIETGAKGSYPDGMVAWTAKGGTERLLFAASDATYGRELREMSSKGVAVVADLMRRGADSNPSDLHVNGGILLAAAASSGVGRELVILDPETKALTTVDIRPGREGSDPHGFLSWDRTWTFFSANDGTSGQELWVTDGTAEGTRLVADLNPGPEGSHPWILGRGGNVLYIQAWTSAKGNELVALDLGPR